MQTVLIQLTEELRQCIDHARGSEPLGPFVERLLRRTSAIRTAQKALRLEIPERRRRGRPAKRTS